MDISQRGIDFIVSFEGKKTLLPDGRYKSYLDTLAKPAVWTVYCGLTKGVTKDTCVTVDEAEKMFSKELAVYEDHIEKLVKVPLNQNQFDALVSFVYNCGPEAFRTSTLLEVLNKGQYSQVPAQLSRWVNAGGKPYNGLIRRRAGEGALFMEPMPQEIPAHEEEAAMLMAMPQRVEAAPAATVTQAVTGSATVKAAAVAVPGAAWAFFQNGYDWVVGLAKEAGPEIVSLKTTLGPFDALLKLTPTILVGLTVVGLGVVVARKVADRYSGKSV